VLFDVEVPAIDDANDDEGRRIPVEPLSSSLWFEIRELSGGRAVGGRSNEGLEAVVDDADAVAEVEDEEVDDGAEVGNSLLDSHLH
jgi:hypothetical protein